ncbi:hypothetical protein [Moritella viscosa]|uniref:hypothetical protein n=1 Tax=Moritella viscosa TaxID=80854 RepID=UPI00116034EF|nr:hypothetical protein [Moritella viscosa]
MFTTTQTQQLLSATNALDTYPIDLLIVGATGSGKSTTIAALMPKGKRKQSNKRSLLPDIHPMEHYQVHPRLRIWDSMGPGDSPKRDELHEQDINRLLQQSYPYQRKHYAFIDMVLLIIDGSSRDIGTAIRLINNALLPNIPIERIVIAINQADRAMKGLHWNTLTKTPCTPLKHYLALQSQSIQQRLTLSCKHHLRLPVCYSDRHRYQLSELLTSLLQSLPREKREVVEYPHHSIKTNAT